MKLTHCTHSSISYLHTWVPHCCPSQEYFLTHWMSSGGLSDLALSVFSHFFLQHCLPWIRHKMMGHQCKTLGGMDAMRHSCNSCPLSSRQHLLVLYLIIQTCLGHSYMHSFSSHSWDICFLPQSLQGQNHGFYSSLQWGNAMFFTRLLWELMRAHCKGSIVASYLSFPTKLGQHPDEAPPLLWSFVHYVTVLIHNDLSILNFIYVWPFIFSLGKDFYFQTIDI